MDGVVLAVESVAYAARAHRRPRAAARDLSGRDGDTRQRIVEAAYACVARRGVAKTTIEDVAREAGMSRATVYRAVPGGRDELINATVAWATLDFFGKLYERIQGAASLEEVMERGIMFAYRSIVEHEVLQRVMQTEPDKLLPILTVESNRIREGIAGRARPLPGGAGAGRRGGSRPMPPTSWPGWSCPTSPLRALGPRGSRAGGSAGPVGAPGRRGRADPIG